MERFKIVGRERPSGSAYLAVLDTETGMVAGFGNAESSARAADAMNTGTVNPTSFLWRADADKH